MYNKGIQETTTTEENKMKLQQQIIFDQVRDLFDILFRWIDSKRNS
jgi:hypothetical protein